MTFWNRLLGKPKPDAKKANGMDEKRIVDNVVDAMTKRQAAIAEEKFETAGKGIKSIVCSDDDCPCTDQRQLKLGQDAYLYTSPQVVEFRKDCRTVLEVEMRISRLSKPQDLLAAMQYSMPKFVCEIGAKRRGLDLAVALADGVAAASTGFVPLRPTPKILVQQADASLEEKAALNSLLSDLLSPDRTTREQALVGARELANRGVHRGIDALEIAIRRKAGTAVEFHVPGLALIEGAVFFKSRETLLGIAKRGAICREARLVGSLMSSLFLNSGDEVRRMLSDIRDAGGEEQVLQFQLIGTHLQAVAGYKRSGATQY